MSAAPAHQPREDPDHFNANAIDNQPFFIETIRDSAGRRWPHDCFVGGSKGGVLRARRAVLVVAVA
jgi:hypothetical protein